MVMLAGIIPDITFQEAYEKTGRMISITIAPYEEHQKSRLMNAVTSPNVFIRSAVQASCAVPGVYPPVMLKAKNVYGEEQPYLQSRRWVDGGMTDDLPAKRLGRIYGVNHYIASQANPLALALMGANNFPMPEAMKNFADLWTRECLKASERFSRQYLRDFPALSRSFNTFNSVIGQDYTGDITILPSFNFVDPQKLLAQLTEEEIDELIDEGIKATWPKLEQIKLCTKIGNTLEEILDEHHDHNVKAFYKKRKGAAR